MLTESEMRKFLDVSDIMRARGAYTASTIVFESMTRLSAEPVAQVVKDSVCTRRPVLMVPLVRPLAPTDDERQQLREGDMVIVRNDVGNDATYLVKSSPWKLAHGEWVIGLDGIAGGYLLSRVVGIMSKARRVPREAELTPTPVIPVTVRETQGCVHFFSAQPSGDDAECLWCHRTRGELAGPVGGESGGA